MTLFDCTADLVGQLNGNGQKGMLQIDAPHVENSWLRHWIWTVQYRERSVGRRAGRLGALVGARRRTGGGEVGVGDTPVAAIATRLRRRVVATHIIDARLHLSRYESTAAHASCRIVSYRVSSFYPTGQTDNEKTRGRKPDPCCTLFTMLCYASAVLCMALRLQLHGLH